MSSILRIGSVRKSEGRPVTPLRSAVRVRLALATLPCLLLLLVPVSAASDDNVRTSQTQLELGYRQMYDLKFEEAHRSFQLWKQVHPDDPMAPVSDAAAFLFSEFNRLGILRSEFITSDEKIRKSGKPVPDPVAKQGFEKSLSEAERLADAALARSPGDSNALFAKLLVLGLRADYVGLIEKKLLASIGIMKDGRILARKLLAQDPSNYDAYLAIGVENYILGSTPAPVRWLLQVFGSRADRTRGINELQITAEKGHYLLPYARLLLAAAALRDKNRDKARDLLEGLAREFPNNPLYAEELARLR